MAIEHWITAHLLGANASFQRSAREYAEEYAAMAVAAERERCAQYLRDAAERLAPKGKRINQVDRHCARVLATMADELALSPNVM